MTLWQPIWDVVEEIPRGRVATYGQVAALAGLPGHARHVGRALAALPAGTDVPWHRVVNAKGEISLRNSGDGHDRQRARLLEEGIPIDVAGRLRLADWRWARNAGPRIGQGSRVMQTSGAA